MKRQLPENFDLTRDAEKRFFFGDGEYFDKIRMSFSDIDVEVAAAGDLHVWREQARKIRKLERPK
jgi:hypothetical protein